MGKVRSYHGYEIMSQAFPDLSDATLAALRAQKRYIYLVESRNYDMEAVLSSFLATVEAPSEQNRFKDLVVAPPLGPYDFSRGELVSFTRESPETAPVDYFFMHNLRDQLNSNTWTLPRVLWEIALHEFIAPLDTDSPETEVDDVRFGNFWLNGQDDFLSRFYEKRLSTGFKFIKNPDMNPASIDYAPAAERIFGSISTTFLSYHRVMPEPIAELTRAQVAEAIQIGSYQDVSKRATRDQLIRDAIAKLAPGSYRRNRLRFAEDIAGRGNSIAFSYRDDGSYTIFNLGLDER